MIGTSSSTAALQITFGNSYLYASAIVSGAESIRFSCRPSLFPRYLWYVLMDFQQRDELISFLWVEGRGHSMTKYAKNTILGFVSAISGIH